MARIRTIKPEFFTSEQVIELRPLTRLTFIGMWPFCDDHGVHVGSIKTLKAEIYPADDVTLAELRGMVDELITRRLLVEYSANGKFYWHVTGWAAHQKIDRPSYRHPFPYEENQIVMNHSTNARRTLDEHSVTEWNGMEWKGMELKPQQQQRVREQLEAVVEEKTEQLQEMFPGVDVAVAAEKLIAYKEKSSIGVVLDPWLVVLKWFQREFKPQPLAGARASPGGREAERNRILEENRQACREFAGEV